MAGACRSPPSSPLASAASPRPPSAMAARGQGAAALGHGGRSQAGHVQVRAAFGSGAAWRVQGGVVSGGGAEAGGWVAVGGGEKAGGGAVVDGGRRVVQQNHIGRKRVFSHSKYMIKKKRKDGKYIKWQYNQVVDVWSPIFTKMMFGMANMRSATIGVLFLQFSPAGALIW